MSVAERKKKSRERMRQDEDKWKEVQEKQKVWDERRREKRRQEHKESQEIRESYKKKERLRKRKQRENKKLAQVQNYNNSGLGSYKCLNTLKKAVVKTKKALPQSPTKKTAVLQQMFKEVNLQMPTLLQKPDDRRSNNAITDEVKKKVQAFYETDDISRASPNRKDTMSIKDSQSGERTHVAKRHMTMAVAEAYSLFVTDNPDVNLGKSKFFEYRPLHVRPMSDMPHNVCVCIHHANYNFLLQALNKIAPIVPGSSTEFLKEITCDISNEKCIAGECSKCYKISDILPLKLDTTMKVTWNQWKSVENRFQIVTATGTLKDLLEELDSKTLKFKYHVFTKNEQSKYFKTKIKESTETEIVLQIDFAENFAILNQDEIQSAYWSHGQVTLFTGCAWASQGQEKHSYVIMSDELTHNKYSVWLFIKKIIDDLKSRYGNLKKVNICSDGCAAQFKNRFTLSTLCFSVLDWGIEINWSFFASGHGKGVVDGIGAIAKRTLWSAIMTRKAVIKNSRDCYEYLVLKGINGFHIFFIGADDIKEHQANLDKRWQNIKTIPHIQKHHHFEGEGNTCIVYTLTATSSEYKKVSIIQEDKLNYSEVYNSSDSE
ncbi:unnamed protein product [Brassicogethes aeneus]|uniref:Uncharacterized protein n=1 Tax=Brassicogethes aeneus TaxID=1431903 RepID=A0A9P0BF13_BRAAE|nr:unnamed protein product [Brassicogethes aeneus]